MLSWFHFNKHALIQDQISLATTVVTSEPLEFYPVYVRNNPRKRGEKPEQAEVLLLKKNRKKSPPSSASGSGYLAGSWLSISLLLSQLCQLDCLVPVQITMFTTRLLSIHEPDRASGTTIGLSVFPCGTDF